MRRFFTKRRTFVVVAVLLAVAGVAWFSNRGPREPVFEGRKLSWWFTDEGMALRKTNGRNAYLTREELQSLGPEAVEWLGYMAAQTNVSDMDEPSSSRSWVKQFVWDLRVRWYGGSVSKFDRLRFGAIGALSDLGPDAAPAIPSLVKAIHTADHDGRLVAADGLLAMGPVSWSAVREAIKYGDPWTRGILVYKLDGRWAYEQMQSDPREFAETVELLVPLTLQEDEYARTTAERQLKACREAWKAQPRVTEGVALVAASLAGEPEIVRRGTARFLADFEEQGAVAIPALAALVETPDELTRVEVLGALALIEPNNARWPERLRELAASPKKEVAAAAERALIHAGK